jgi:hypothetical protein
MPKCLSTYSFRFSRFIESKCKGYLCSLESPVAEMLKCPSAYSFEFLRFTKSGCKGYLCSLESPVVEMSKCQNVETSKFLGVQSTTHNNPWDLWSMSDLAISLFCDSGFWETRTSVLPTRDTRNREMDLSSRASCDQRFTSTRNFMIWGFERQGSLSFQLTVPKIVKWPNNPDLFEINGHYSS